MAWGLGVGRSRTKLGRFLDTNGITQGWLERKSGLSETTVTKLCSDRDYNPQAKTKIAVVSSLRSIDPDISVADFW